jgi:hypothetical protein
MRNKRQLAAAFVVAAILSVGMPLSANDGVASSDRSFCAFLIGLGQKGVPSAVIDALLPLFGCSAQ